MATLGNSTITTLSLLNALGVADGGTGAKTFTSGAALIGNGTGAFATRSITNNTSATAVTASTNLITANTLYYHKGNSNIVTVGTITSGTWQGTAIANAYLANSKVTIAGKDISLGGSLSAADLKTALGLNNVSNTAASGYFTALSSNTTNAVSITIGGTTKNITASTMKTSLGLGSLAYLSSISASIITQGYLNTHPENSPIVVPFIYNDLAFLNKKGGSYKVYRTTSTNYTVASLTETAVTLQSGDNMFDGSPSYATISDKGEFTAVIDMTLHKMFQWSNVFYIDFGAVQWRTKNIAVYVMNSETQTAYVLKQSIADNAKGHWFCGLSHSSTNASGSTVQGFNKLRVVISGFATSNTTSGKRIAQIGLLNYGSAGVTETYISRGGCAGVYGSLVPHTTNSINLGSSSKKWANVYATTFNGNATSATKATQDGDGNVITTTYAKIADVSGLDIFAGMTLKTGVNAKTHSGWDNVAKQDKIIPTMNFIAYWNGAYNSSNGSNLTYCVKGAFGDAAIKAVTTSVTSGSASLVTSGGVYTALASYLPLTGGTLAASNGNTPLTIKGTASGNDAWIAFHNNSGFLASLGIDSSKNLKLYKDSKSYTVWHEGNDGSGSGLDADKLDGNEASAFALADGSNASGTWGISISGNAGSTDNSYYLFTQQQNNTSFYPNYKAYIKWIANDTASMKFTDGTYKFKADLAGTADDSAKLNGQAASYYATAASLASYLALDGSRTMTGAIKVAETKGILFRHSNTTYTAGIGYDTQGNECIAMWAKNSVTRLRWHAGKDMSGTTYQQMMSITPDFEISKADGTAKGYIGGSAIITAANIESYIPDGGGNTVDLTNYVVKNGTGVQCIGGGLVVGSTSTTIAAAAGRVMITGHTNPLIGLIATGSSTPFYFQVTNDVVYLGPTSSVALSLDGSGNTTVRGTLTANKDVTTSGKYIGSLNNSLTIFGKAYNNSAAVTIADTDIVASVTEGTLTCTDNTEFLTSWASDNGFNDTSGKNKLYRRKMSKVYDYIKGKLDSVYLGKTANAVNGTFYGVCSTAAATLAKTVEIDGFPSTPTEGTRVTIKFTYASANASTSSPMTLNVNSTGAYPVYIYGTTIADNSATTTGWTENAVVTFTFDGTAWIRDYWRNSTYSNVSLGQGYATCSTDGDTVAKTASLSSYTLSTGGVVSVRFTNYVPASATLNINSKGAKAIYYKNSAITAGIIGSGDTATFIYNGTYYHLISIDKPTEAKMADKAKMLVDESGNNIMGPISMSAYPDTRATYFGTYFSNVAFQAQDVVQISVNYGRGGVNFKSDGAFPMSNKAYNIGSNSMQFNYLYCSRVYVNGKNIQTTISSETATSKTISPNIFYKWGTMSSLAITIGTPSDETILNNYMFEVTAGASGCNLTLSTSSGNIKWANGSALSALAANATYQFSIINNCVVWTKFV